MTGERPRLRMALSSLIANRTIRKNNPKFKQNHLATAVRKYKRCHSTKATGRNKSIDRNGY